MAKIIAEARTCLALTPDDNRSETFEKIADFLDQELDELLSPPDTSAALLRLAERGDLPSDLYKIDITQNIADVYRKNFFLEKDIIETTIRAPTLEQHYGPPRGPLEPSMLSLFMRSFKTKWPIKNFRMVVAGQRDGFKLHVHQAWRVYPWEVSLEGVVTPVDYLRRFAEHYGAEIEIEGKKGHFFLLADGPIPNTVKFRQRVDRGREESALITRFAQYDSKTGVEKSALVVAIDIPKYRAVIDELGVGRQDILDRFVPAPKATI